MSYMDYEQWESWQAHLEWLAHRNEPQEEPDEDESMEGEEHPCY